MSNSAKKIGFGILLLSSLMILNLGYSESHSEKESFIRSLITDLSREMKRNFDLECMICGETSINEIKDLALVFVSPRSPRLNEARQLFLEVADLFFQKVSEETKIYQYLNKNTFAFENIAFMINFDKSYQSNSGDELVDLVFSTEGKIYYSTRIDCSDSLDKNLFDLKMETFQEARSLSENSHKD